eukprot:COSAG06_NODE_5606_length_3366_cov_5.365473_5_plen_160_part_00
MDGAGKRLLSSRFIYKNDHFAKTGSGQTWESRERKKRSMRFLQASETAARGWQPTKYAQYWDPARSGDAAHSLHPLSSSASAFGGGGSAPDGPGLKNPRGPITARRISAGPLAGLHLLLYYNNACEGYGAKHATFCAVYILKRSFCQDRLGTNIGKTQK